MNGVYMLNVEQTEQLTRELVECGLFKYRIVDNDHQVAITERGYVAASLLILSVSSNPALPEDIRKYLNAAALGMKVLSLVQEY